MRNCVVYFEQQSFSKPRIDRYKSMWRSGIVAYMAERSIRYYDVSIGDEFLRTHFAECIAASSRRDFIKSIHVLSDLQMNGNISKRRCQPVERNLSGPIGLLMEQFLSYLESLRRHRETIIHHRLHLHRFLSFLESKQIWNIVEIKEEHIIIFVSTITNSRICLISSLRNFFRYLFDNHLLSSDLSEALRHYKWNKRVKLPSVYTTKEVLQIETSIKREDPTGKRNFAMMLLATRLGLRVSDIAHLTFDNISWEKSRITLTQFKTGNEIELPLLANVGEAIIDYLKYGRKKSESQNIFLYARPPFSAISNDAVAMAIAHLIDSSGVDKTRRKHGAHAMRHSLASRFLENKESMPVISESLGHQNTDTTMSYLRIDIESLRQCALDTPAVSNNFYVQKGGAFYE